MKIFKRDGSICTLEDFLILHTGEYAEYLKVAEDEVNNSIVSTVWLGINHNFEEDGPPLIFETMIFPECKLVARYSTEEQAIIGHDRIIKELKFDILPRL